MPIVPGSRSQSQAQRKVRPPEADPQWSQTPSQAAPLRTPRAPIYLCPMLSTDYTPGCHFDDRGTSDCIAATGEGYPGHRGIDFINSSGKDVYAVEDGVVVAVCTVDDGQLGTWVWIRHMDETYSRIVDTIYAHVTPAVNAGDSVTENTVIGTVADPTTGLSDAPHLHLELIIANCANPDNGWEATELTGYETAIYTWRDGKWVDPLKYIPCGKFKRELLQVAAVPPPAQVPAGPPPAYQGLRDPFWLTYRNPYDGEDNIQRVDGGPAPAGHMAWYMAGWDSVSGTVDVYPICDSPCGWILVAKATSTAVTLLHLSTGYRTMVVSEYTSLTSVDVVEGSRIGATTKIGSSNVADAAVHGVQVSLYRKTAASPTEWATGEPFDWTDSRLFDQYAVTWDYMADPACCLPEPSTFYATGGSPTWNHDRDCGSEPGWA